MNTNNLNLIYTPVPFFCDLLFLDLKLLCCVYYIILGSFYFPSQKTTRMFKDANVNLENVVMFGYSVIK